LKTTQQILSEYGIAIEKEDENNYLTLCPFHDDNNPSFSIRKDDGRYKCWSCNEKGNLLTFIQKIENITKEQAKEKLYGKENINKPSFFFNTFILKEKKDDTEIKIKQKYYEVKHFLDLMFNPSEPRNRNLKYKLKQIKNEDEIIEYIHTITKFKPDVHNVFNTDLIDKFNQIETYYKGEEYERLIEVIKKFNLQDEFNIILNLINNKKYRRFKQVKEQKNEVRKIVYNYYKENYKEFDKEITSWIN